MLTVEQEHQAVVEELRRARATLESSLRAGLEGRVTDPEVHRHSLQRKRWAVMELERAEARLREMMEDGA